MGNAVTLLVARLRALFRARALDDDFEQELDSHLAMLIEDNVRAGMTRDEAERAAHLRLGGAQSLKAQHRDRRGLPALENMWQDLRFAIRLTVKERWFSAAAIAALALGIGANATGFSIVHAAFFRGLPFEDGQRLCQVAWQTRAGRTASVSHADFTDWRAAARTIALAAVAETDVNISDDRAMPEHGRGAWVTANAFRVLRQRPLLGRDFTADEDRIGSVPVAIIGYDLWTNRYGADPSVLGQTLRINGVARTIVGVMPADMKFAENASLWAPFIPTDEQQGRDLRALDVFGRLEDGTARTAAQAELNAIAQQMIAATPEATGDFVGIRVDPYTVGGYSRTLFTTVMVAMGFVLLIACANVANLLLSRSAYRAREIALRIALGATRARVVRQLLLESFVLAVLGGTLGLGLAATAVNAFERAMLAADKPYWLVFTVDQSVVLYVAGLCLLTSVLFGLAPALHLSGANNNEMLKEGGRSQSDSQRVRWFSSTMVVVELALTIVLLAGAGFLIRSFITLYSLDVGIRTEQLLAMRLELLDDRYPTPASRWDWFDRVRSRVQAIPGVQSAALTTGVPPLDGGERLIEIDRAGAIRSPRFVSTVTVSPEFFAVVDRSVLRGRNFHAGDGAPGAEAVIINERLAAEFFAGQDPIGRQLRFTQRNPRADQPRDVWRTVVGVSAPIRHGSPHDAYLNAVVYVPYRQHAPAAASLLVRTALPPETLMNAVRRVVHAEDPDQPVFAMQTVARILDAARWPYRIFGSMFAIVAVGSLLLSALGLYAVMAYAVSRRRHEIGVRMAVGANRAQVSWMILERGLAQLAVGVSLGLTGAVGLGAVLNNMLVDMTPADPLTLAGVAFLLTMVAIGACLLPARRATRVDPLVVLRAE